MYKDQRREDGNDLETDTVSVFQNTPELKRAKTYSALSFDLINFFSMVNSFTLSRKPFVMCYCFRESNDCQIARLALVCGRPNWKKPYNKHLISFVFSVRTVNYGCSFFPSIYGPGAYKLMKKKNSVHNLQYGPKTRLIRGIY